MVRALAPWHDPTASISIQANAVSSGLYFNCALTTYAGIRCWGYNVYGQLGDGTEERRTSPVDVVELSSGVANFDAGNSHTCEHYEVYRSATAPYCSRAGRTP